MLASKDQDASQNDANVINPQDQPGDTVSSLSWIPNTQYRYLAASSWDSKIRLYELAVQGYQKGLGLKSTFNIDDPALCTGWSEDCKTLFAGSINTKIYAYDVTTGQSAVVGQHEHGVRDVYWLPGMNVLASLSYDKTIKFWDLKSPQSATSFNLGYKVYCSDFLFPVIAVGLSDEKMLIINLNNMQALQKTPLDYIDSPLGPTSQLTAIGFFTDGSGLGSASHDGRANLSQMSQDNNGRIKLNNIMTFKCHKVEQGTQTLYPVHGIGFHPKAKNFVYTAGGEGNIFFWDYQAKNKIVGFNYKNTPVTKTKMAPDGACLAYALGYDWAKGIEGYMSHKPKLCVHIMADNELMYSGK